MKAKGFTLIEMLIVVVLIGMVSVPLFVKYRYAQQNQALRVSAEEFADRLRGAHIYARNARDRKAWGVVRQGTSGYALVSGKSDEYAVDTTYELEKGIEFAGGFSIWFVAGSGDAEETSVVIVNSGGRKMKINVYKSGSVDVEAFE
jgi:prepilin-type N-terminal cleavage/methylation domain-containing protein